MLVLLFEPRTLDLVRDAIITEPSSLRKVFFLKEKKNLTIFSLNSS